MTDPAVTAKQLVDLARKNIESQQCRIARQRELMAKYERDDDVARLSGARLVLERMQKQLAQMTAAHVAAEEHLATLTVELLVQPRGHDDWKDRNEKEETKKRSRRPNGV